jgi:hypothetical protein
MIRISMRFSRGFAPGSSPYWADPGQTQQGQINHHDGRRWGLCFEDPDGHFLEIITRPYGSGGWNA